MSTMASVRTRDGNEGRRAFMHVLVLYLVSLQYTRVTSMGSLQWTLESPVLNVSLLIVDPTS